MSGSARRTELLEAAAKALEGGQVPLSSGFLAEHDVTADECIALANQLAIGARVVAKGLATPKTMAGLAVFETIAEGVL